MRTACSSARATISVHSLDLKSGREKLFLNKPGISLFQAKFSPDDQWIAVEGASADEGQVAISDLACAGREWDAGSARSLDRHRSSSSTAGTTSPAGHRMAT
jgi:hypothetical protein